MRKRNEPIRTTNFIVDYAQWTLVELERIFFKSLSDNHILSYLEKEDVLHCAGSFKSEGLGAALNNRMEGNDPNSLIGLPTIKLTKMLAKENVHIL